MRSLPAPAPRQIKHWSYSSLKLFEDCPARWRYSKILKLPEPKSDALERGEQVHKQMEAYLLGRTSKPHINIDIAPDIVELLEKLDGYDDMIIEEMWHFDESWQFTGTEFTPESWLLAKMDVVDLDHCHIVDWKTGRIYPDSHQQQALLYAVSAASRTFETDWTVDMAYLDQGQVVTYNIDASDLAGAQARWGKRANKIFEAQKKSKFEEKPSRESCRYCPFKASKGGPCTKEW